MAVTFATEVTDALLEGRVLAESLMVDTCLLERLGAPTTGPDGAVTTPRTTVYAGPCKVATYEPQERRPEAGGAVWTVQRYALHIPVASCFPEVGMVATMTTCTWDPGLVGRVFRVVALLHKSMASAYRLGIEGEGMLA